MTIKKHNHFNAFQKAVETIVDQVNSTPKSISYRHIVKNWSTIFDGMDVASEISPKKLIKNEAQGKAVLVVSVPEYKKLEWLHSTDNIIEKINTYFGQNLVARIKITSVIKNSDTMT